MSVTLSDKRRTVEYDFGYGALLRYRLAVAEAYGVKTALIAAITPPFSDINEIKDRLRRTWDICRKYRPWRRAMKYIEHEVGNGKARPICPHCHEAFALEEITDFRHQNKSGLEYTSHGHNVTNVE